MTIKNSLRALFATEFEVVTFYEPTVVLTGVSRITLNVSLLKTFATSST
jgi:hypothetical protein